MLYTLEKSGEHEPMQMRGRPTYPAELTRIREQLGITQERFGELLGVNNDTVSRYELGKNAVPEPVIRLARLIMRQWDSRQPIPV